MLQWNRPHPGGNHKDDLDPFGEVAVGGYVLLLLMVAYFVLAAIGALVVLLARTRISPALLFAGTLLLFYFAGLIPTKVMLEEFVNEALVTVVLLLLVAFVIEKTALSGFLRRFIFVPGKHRLSLTRLCLVSSALSAFLNNTAVAASFLGAIKRNSLFPASRFLIPLSYAVTLGGTVTLIGTSTNLIVGGLLIDHGLRPLGIFDLAWVGIPAALAGIIVLVLLPQRLLEVREVQSELKPSRIFLEAKVLQGSKHIGKTVEENGFRHLESLFLAEIVRGDRLISPAGPDEVVEEGDTLVFVGDVKNVREVEKFDKVQLFEEDNSYLLKNLREAIVSHESQLVGKTIKEAGFRARFDAAVIAVRRGGEKLAGKIGNMRIMPGDALILAVGSDFDKRLELGRDFYYVSTVSIPPSLPLWGSVVTLVLFGAAIVLSALGVVPLVGTLLAITFTFVALKFISATEIRDNLRIDLVIIMGSAFGISQVMIETGAAEMVASLVTSTFDSYGPWSTMVGIYLLTVLLTQVLTNNAVAALLFPVAYASALQLEANTMPFVMAVVYGASASFLTPYAHQTNLMVYSAGNYQFLDYLKVGLPLILVYSTVVLGLIPLFFPFDPVMISQW